MKKVYRITALRGNATRIALTIAENPSDAKEIVLDRLGSQDTEWITQNIEILASEDSFGPLPLYIETR